MASEAKPNPVVSEEYARGAAHTGYVHRYLRPRSAELPVTCDTAPDKETGVNYLFFHRGNGGGLTPLLDSDGKPIITKDGYKK